MNVIFLQYLRVFFLKYVNSLLGQGQFGLRPAPPERSSSPRAEHPAVAHAVTQPPTNPPIRSRSPAGSPSQRLDCARHARCPRCLPLKSMPPASFYLLPPGSPSVPRSGKLPTSKPERGKKAPSLTDRHPPSPTGLLAGAARLLDFRRLPVRVAAGLGHSAGRVSAVASTASFAVVVRVSFAVPLDFVGEKFPPFCVFLSRRLVAWLRSRSLNPWSLMLFVVRSLVGHDSW
jgi:hypothetical protein